MNIRIAVICPSEIALRRFMPALQEIKGVEFVGVGVSAIYERCEDNVSNAEEVIKAIETDRDKASIFIKKYGGVIFDSYEDVVTSEKVDAIYIPLPPALHYLWAKKALECGKHVLVEKPSTISASQSKELVDIARKNCLALHENYMFMFHAQLDAIEAVVESGEIGETRLYRIDFGFPMREANDFRYNKKLGGGALIDAGGYILKYATRLLGESVVVKAAQLNFMDGYEVDMYGSAMLVNRNGDTVQVAFGMDNDYRCDLNVWGSKGSIHTGRILTAPAGYVPEMTIRKANEVSVRKLPEDNTFKKSIEFFVECIGDEMIRSDSYDSIVRQAELVECFKKHIN